LNASFFKQVADLKVATASLQYPAAIRVNKDSLLKQAVAYSLCLFTAGRLCL